MSRPLDAHGTRTRRSWPGCCRCFAPSRPGAQLARGALRADHPALRGRAPAGPSRPRPYWGCRTAPRLIPPERGRVSPHQDHCCGDPFLTGMPTCSAALCGGQADGDLPAQGEPADRPGGGVRGPGRGGRDDQTRRCRRARSGSPHGGGPGAAVLERYRPTRPPGRGEPGRDIVPPWIVVGYGTPRISSSGTGIARPSRPASAGVCALRRLALPELCSSLRAIRPA